MNAFWSYFWPPFGAGLAVAIIAGAIAFRSRRRRNVALCAGAVVAVALAEDVRAAPADRLDVSL